MTSLNVSALLALGTGCAAGAYQRDPEPFNLVVLVTVALLFLMALLQYGTRR